MELFLRKIIHPQAHDNYCVILKDDGVEIELGSIGVQFDGWVRVIDSLVPMRELETESSGKDRKDCMRQFRAAWNRFSADPARLTEFLDIKRKRLRVIKCAPLVAALRRPPLFEDMHAYLATARLAMRHAGHQAPLSSNARYGISVQGPAADQAHVAD